MISIVIGCDPQKTRMGWAALDAHRMTPLDCGCEPLDTPGGGWLYQQTHRAVLDVASHIDRACERHDWDVIGVCLEEAITPHVSRAKEHGAAAALIEADLRRRWPHAPVWYLTPGTWKKTAVGAGNATKDQVRDWAWTTHKVERSEQDALDALAIAHAAAIQLDDMGDAA